MADSASRRTDYHHPIRRCAGTPSPENNGCVCHLRRSKSAALSSCYAASGRQNFRHCKSNAILGVYNGKNPGNAVHSEATMNPSNDALDPEATVLAQDALKAARSEERRVGKEW